MRLSIIALLFHFVAKISIYDFLTMTLTIDIEGHDCILFLMIGIAIQGISKSTSYD